MGAARGALAWHSSPWWQKVVAVAALPSLAAALWGTTAAFTWSGELVVHWSLHTAFALATAACLLRQQRGWAGACLALMVVALVPWLLAARLPHARAVGPVGNNDRDYERVTVATANLFKDSLDRVTAFSAFDTEKPGVVCAVEVAAEDQARLAHDPRWPYQTWNFPTGAFRWNGTALLSRWPLANVEQVIIGETPIIVATVAIPDHPFTVIACHPRAPMSPRWRQARDTTLAWIGKRAALVNGPLLLLGDWNCTVGSPVWRRFQTDNGLALTAGPTPATWPAQLGPLGIGIDHIVVRGFATTPVRAVTLPGSDHRGLVCELSFSP